MLTLTDENIEGLRNITDLVRWTRLTRKYTLSEAFILEFRNYLDLNEILQYQTLSEDFIGTLQTLFHFINRSWNEISMRQKLSSNFIRAFQEKLDWALLSMHQALSEEFIIEFKDKVRWDYISEYQKLSKQFILENFGLINVDYLKNNKNLIDLKFDLITGDTDIDLLIKLES